MAILIFLAQILSICKNQEQICHIIPARFHKHVCVQQWSNRFQFFPIDAIINTCLLTLCLCVFIRAPTNCRSWCGDATPYDPLKAKVSTLRSIPLELETLKFQKTNLIF
jgi:hypothetical protein